MAVAGVALVAVDLTNQSFIRARRPKCAAELAPARRNHVVDAMPDLISAFDQVDVVALGEEHGLFRLDSELRIAIVRHPDFARKVRSIVVEFGSTTEQSTRDVTSRQEKRIKRPAGEVWKTTTQSPTASGPTHLPGLFRGCPRRQFEAAGRARFASSAVTRTGRQPYRENAAVSVLKEQVLQSTVRPWLFMAPRTSIGLCPKITCLPGRRHRTRKETEIDFPGRTLWDSVADSIVRARSPADMIRYQKFDRALKTQVRRYWCPSNDCPSGFHSEEFLGRTFDDLAAAPAAA